MNKMSKISAPSPTSVGKASRADGAHQANKPADTASTDDVRRFAEESFKRFDKLYRKLAE